MYGNAEPDISLTELPKVVQQGFNITGHIKKGTSSSRQTIVLRWRQGVGRSLYFECDPSLRSPIGLC